MISAVKIIDALDIINDTVKPYENTRPYLDTGGLKFSDIDEIKYFNFHEKPSRANLNVKSGDLILARMQSTVKAKLIVDEDEDLMISTGFLVLRPAKSIIEPAYLFYIITSSYFQNEKDRLCSGSTQKAINNSNFKKLSIPLPPLEEQKKIAAVLDAADAYRQKTKALIDKYDQLTQSLFLDMFGDPVINPMRWDEEPLSNSIDSIIDYRGKTPPKSTDGIPLLSSANVQSGQIDLSYKQFISTSDYAKWTVRGFTKPLDLLFTTEAPVCEVALIPSDGRVYQISRRVMALRFDKDKLNPVFGLNLMLQKNWVERLKKLTRGSTVPRLLKPDILKQIIIRPSIEKQNQFAERVAQVEKQKQQAEASLVKAEELFSSLLQRAFKGELSS